MSAAPKLRAQRKMSLQHLAKVSTPVRMQLFANADPATCNVFCLVQASAPTLAALGAQTLDRSKLLS